jgi:hypothetical protein
MFNKEELNEWLVKVGSKTEKPLKIYMIGGCALSFRGLKDATKDIDIIVENQKDFDILDNAIKNAGFEIKTDLDDEFYLTALAVYVKGDDSRIDVFLKQVGKMLKLTQSMIKRANFFHNYDKLSVHLISLEDIFLFKSMSSRKGDIVDCDRIMRRGIDYDIVYNEIVEQSKEEGKRWFFWIYENMCKLDNYNKLGIPIKNKVFALVKKHWKERPDDFMEDISNKGTHIPDKKLFNELKD